MKPPAVVGSFPSLSHDEVVVLARQQLNYIETLEELDAAPLPPRLDYKPILPEPSDVVKGEVRRELRNLAFFTALPADIPASVSSFARLITLRVFGGWSLERIAEHDNRSIADVNSAWEEARAWVRNESREAEAVGSLITVPIITTEVLCAMRDSPQLLHVVEWRTFELLLSRILESFGYEVELQRGTKDGGVDIIAVKATTTFGAHRYLVQAKRTKNRIGVEPVRELLFLKQEYGATKACLATTSSFTAGAWKLANEHRWELELRDFERLRDWLRLLRVDR